MRPFLGQITHPYMTYLYFWSVLLLTLSGRGSVWKMVIAPIGHQQNLKITIFENKLSANRCSFVKHASVKGPNFHVKVHPKLS